ncbi:alpha/beta fold hydrolase [Streptomyces hainanensis]|uniref:Alpha/beta fold hydrolase n=1 Tax=Streptomyces hainanensis TaxID=402648 RepID=A0A4R4TBU4_9ACTN|nr:alpha/beta fold hydrolase [Streptomyces hainanensis]TDC73526.1 alpha/beta fold hydrolase [Streptomyces hainanensis]
MAVSEFRNDKIRDRFSAAYQQALETLWPPGSRETLDVPTSFGTTRAYRTGPSDATGPQDGGPIVLLSGGGGNSLMWHGYIDALSRQRPVIAVDTVGEPGASVQTAPIADGRDGAAWLGELLAALDVTGGHAVGCSCGGWLSLHHQVHHPGRIAGLTLVEPGGLATPGPRFFAWVMASGLAGIAPLPLRPRLARLIGNSAILERELMRMIRAGVGFRRALPLAHVLTDEEMRRVRVPSLFLLGERSALHDSRRAADRIGALMPAATVEIVPGAGHALPTDRQALVVERILEAAGR